MAYASIEQLQARWRFLSPEELETASILLEDASAILAANGYSEAEDTLLSIAVCNMVRRAMTTDGDAFGVDGQITQSVVWGSALPAGALWISKQEREMLKEGARIGTVKLGFL